MVAENIFHGYQARAKAENWATWTEDNPQIAKMLLEASQLCQSQAETIQE